MLRGSKISYFKTRKPDPNPTRITRTRQEPEGIKPEPEPNPRSKTRTRPEPDFCYPNPSLITAHGKDCQGRKKVQTHWKDLPISSSGRHLVQKMLIWKKKFGYIREKENRIDLNFFFQCRLTFFSLLAVLCHLLCLYSGCAFLSWGA